MYSNYWTDAYVKGVFNSFLIFILSSNYSICLFYVPGALLGCTAVLAYPMAMPYPGGPMAGPDPYAMPMPNQFSGPMPGPDPMAFNFGGPIPSADPYGYPSATSFGRAGPGPQPNANPFGNPNPYANAFAQPEAYGAPSYYNF